MQGKFPLDLSKFKKMSMDKHTTTLQHPDGHSIRIVHSAVSPKMRSQLAALKIEKPEMKMADGGRINEASDTDQRPAPSNEGRINEKDIKNKDGRQTEAPSLTSRAVDAIRNVGTSLVEHSNAKIAQQMADYNKAMQLLKSGDYEGANALVVPYSMNVASNTIGSTNPVKNVAQMEADKVAQRLLTQGEGRVVGSVPQVAPKGTGVNQQDLAKAVSIANRPRNYAEGDVVTKDPKKEAEQQQPLSESLKKDIEGINSGPTQTVDVDMNPLPPGQSHDTPVLASAPPAPGQQQAATPPTLAGAPPPPGQEPSPGEELSTNPVDAYNKRLQGYHQQSEAESTLANATTKALKAAQEKQRTEYNAFVNSKKEFDGQINTIRKEIEAGKIDPKNYWNDHSKVATIIGLIIGGFNPTDKPNAAIQMLQKQMDDNLSAQAKNLDSKHNLLAATIRQYGNMKDGYDAARLYQNDMLVHTLQQKAAESNDLMAKARLNQNIGTLKDQYQPLYNDFISRQALIKLTQGRGTVQADPASFVPKFVPPAHQKDVFMEIKNAQGAAQNHDEIMRQFDTAMDNTKLWGVGSTAQKRMSALFLPMLHDQEGRVNAYEQETLTNLMPRTLDQKETLESKRKGLEEFIYNKMHAPTAKAYGIPLDKFQSTTTDPLARLTDWQRNDYQDAKSRLSKNPNDELGLEVLKRLGVE